MKRNRRAAGLAALVAALLLVVSGCASVAPAAHPGTASPEPGIVDTMDPSSVPPWIAGMTITHATPDLTQSDARSLTSMPWRFVSLEGKRLLFVYAAGDDSCVLPRGFAVTYTTTYVEIWALSRTDPGQYACPALLKLGMVALTLAEPLAGRALIHAPTDSQWPASMLAG